MNPFDYPFAIACVVNVLTTFIIDKQRGLLDFSIGGVLWTHLLNFPFWIVAIVFFTCNVINTILHTTWVKVFWAYLFLPKPKPRSIGLTVLPTHAQPRVDTSAVTSVSGRDITSATPTSSRIQQNPFV